MADVQKILVYRNGSKEYYIEVGQSYQVISKFDADAPDGFQKERTTKFLNPDMATKTHVAFFDMDRKIYDTGLTKNSKALKNLYKNDESAIQTALRQITSLITNPLISIKSADTIDPNNLDFWDEPEENFSVNLGVDLVFNTNDTIQLYQLYQLILQGKLAPAGLESEPLYKTNAQYAVENKSDVVEVSQKRELDKSKALFKFMTLLNTDKNLLNSVLDLAGIRGVDNRTDEALLNNVFTQWLNKDENQNPKRFLEIYKNNYESDSGRQFLTLFTAIKDLERKGVIQRKMSGLVLGEEVLGKTTEEAAQKIAKDPQLLDLVYKEIE